MEPNLVSLKDFASVKEGQDFIIESGLANLIEKWGSNLTVKFNSVVKEVSWTGNRVHVKTTNGEFNSKTHRVWQAEKTGSKWILPTGIEEL